MLDGPGYHNQQLVLAAKICSLLRSLSPSTYNEIAPKIEYWIEYGITEQFTTTDDLAERVSSVAWSVGSYSDISRFLKEFRDAPHRSESMRSFVDQLCTRVLRWFAIAAAEDLSTYSYSGSSVAGGVAPGGWCGFACAASFVGHLIECGLISHDLVRRHLVKPLITHRGFDYCRARAIYELFVTARNTLLQGLLEPGDVQVCFERLATLGDTFLQDDSHHARLQVCSQILHTLGGAEVLNTPGRGAELYAGKLNEFREIHAVWLQRREEEERRGVAEPEQEDGMVAGTSAEINTPVAFVPQDPPTVAIDITIPSSILQAIESPSILHDVVSFPETFAEVPTEVPSPTFSISTTISDLTPTELDEDIGEGSSERASSHHETFYLEDGNVEIACGHTLFRVHSTTISFSSQKLRDILSRSALLHAPMPEGCPRITVADTAQDFAVLLKMIHTPGFPAWRKVPEFTVFASLLRMTTKYGFSDVREQLVDGIKRAYPTKWEAPGTGTILGENIFGSPKPHPNAVLNLFAEQNVKFALPYAAYRAALGGVSSLISDKPGTVLPRLTLASTIYGMEVIRGGLAQLAHSIVCSVSLEGCPDTSCAVNTGTNPPERRMEGLNKIYNAMVKEAKGDVLFSLSLGNIVCANCLKTPVAAHQLWCKMIWGELPRIFGVERSWEEI